MNEEAKQRRLKNFHMNVVPVATIEGAESELKVHVGSEPPDRARMSDLAAFLSELDAEELDALGKLGAFRGYDAVNEGTAHKIDQIARVLLRALSERTWLKEDDFGMDDLLNLAEVVGGLASAYRSAAREMPEFNRRLSAVEERNEGLQAAMDQFLLWPESGGTYIDALKYTGEIVKDAMNSSFARELLYGASKQIKMNVLLHTRQILLGLYGSTMRVPEATKQMTLAELAEHATTYAIKAAGNDDPQFDATDGAHPAWWRGCDHGVKQACEKLQHAVDGDVTGKPSFASEEMNKLAEGILGLRGYKTTLSEILLDLRASTVLREKPDFIDDEVWEDLSGIWKRLKSG